MAKQVPDFKTVFKDILLHKGNGTKPDFKTEFGDNLLQNSEPKKNVTKLDLKEVFKDDSCESGLKPKEEDVDVNLPNNDSGKVFWADGRKLCYPLLSLTIKNDKCPMCGKSGDHQICVQDPPSMQLAQAARKDVERPERDEEDSGSEEFDTEEEKESYKKIKRMVELSGTFVRNTDYNIGNRAYERPALTQYYKTCHERDKQERNESKGTNVVDSALLFKKHHKTEKDFGSQRSLSKEKSLGHSAMNLSHVSSNAAEKASEVYWGKEFGFTKGPMVVRDESSAQFSEAPWDDNIYYNVYGVRPEHHHTPHICKKKTH